MDVYTIENGKTKGLISTNVDLNSLSWIEIRSLIRAGLFSDFFSVGATKDITLDLPAGDNNLTAGSYFSDAVSGTYRVVVLGIDHNSKLEGVNRVHFCIGQDSTGNEICFYDMKMNITNTNVGGWKDCSMRIWLNNTLINGLPSDLSSVITPCTKYTDNINDNLLDIEANVTATSDKLWLLSEFEVFGSIEYAHQYEKNYQKQYDYYKNGASKIRYPHQDKLSFGFSGTWWFRSASYDGSGCFCCSGDAFASMDGADINYGVVPGFTIS